MLSAFIKILLVKPKGIKGTDNLQLFRIRDGSKSLIFALQSTLEQNNIHLNHITTNIKKNDNTQQLSATHKGIEQNFSGNKLMIAMASRIIAKKLANKKWVSKLLLTVL
jgi:hypothetical protein